MNTPIDASSPKPAFTPIEAAARRAGLSADALARACALEEIPVGLLRIGRRRFVPTVQFENFLATLERDNTP